MSEDRVGRIHALLKHAFAPEHLEVFDDSHLHDGHVGAKEWKGHFRVHIIAKQFENTRPLDRHRLVFQALGGMMETDIHALSVSALPPPITAMMMYGTRSAACRAKIAVPM